MNQYQLIKRIRPGNKIRITKCSGKEPGCSDCRRIHIVEKIFFVNLFRIGRTLVIRTDRCSIRPFIDDDFEIVGEKDANIDWKKK